VEPLVAAVRDPGCLRVLRPALRGRTARHQHGCEEEAQAGAGRAQAGDR
jgi:hypothetical protein